MLTKRIIPCLDVKNGKVVKGVQFDNHEDVGEITDLAYKYSKDNADELVFYDISASTKNEVVETAWVKKVADKINIPFCVATQKGILILSATFLTQAVSTTSFFVLALMS